MQKIIVKTKDKDIIQITTADERWYLKSVGEGENEKTIFVPSSTWISGCYPKSIAFMKWLASKGWDEAEAIKESAGNKGSMVHESIERLLISGEVKIGDKFKDRETGEERELTVEEYECLMSFASWYNIVEPVTIATEIVAFNDKYEYAGTIDYICKIKKDVVINRVKVKKGIYVIDFKTSQNIWPSHELQISSYKHAVKYIKSLDEKITKCRNIKLGILQVGYRRNKLGFKFNQIEDQFPLFLNTKKIWEKEYGNIEPKQRDYPIVLKIKVEKDKKIK